MKKLIFAVLFGLALSLSSPALSHDIGEGQVLVQLIGKRAFNTIYKNRSGRTIFVMVSACFAGEGTLEARLNGKLVAFTSTPPNGDSSVSFPVPPNATYSVGCRNSVCDANAWVELR